MLPTNQWGHIIKQSAEEAGVNVDHLEMVDDAEVGVFFVLPVRANNSAAAAMPATIRYPRRPGAHRPLTSDPRRCLVPAGAKDRRVPAAPLRYAPPLPPPSLRATSRLC